LAKDESMARTVLITGSSSGIGRATAGLFFLGVPVSLGPVPSVTFAAYDMNRSFRTANDSMWRFFEPELRRRLAALERPASTAERVGAALPHLLPAGTAP
jgi:hypothetical protein